MDESKLTLSIMTADVGGLVGHVTVHPDVLDTAKEKLLRAREKGLISDFHILRCGDDLELIMTHYNGCDDRRVHEMAWNAFSACREAARELKLYGTEKGLLKEIFTGSLKQMGPGVAELEFVERASEPVVVFMANKTSSGMWNLPLYKIFADPFNTTGLVADPAMLRGFSFKVLDTRDNLEVTLSAPEEVHYLLALIGSTGRYTVSAVYANSDCSQAASVSYPKFEVIGGEITARCEPAVIVRCQMGFPAVGEVMEPFSLPHLVPGWMRGSYNGPVMPVPFYEANPVRSDGPTRVIAAGFQISRGQLIGPHDMFDDPSFDEARRLANKAADYMRRHGPFQPHRREQPDLEYSSLPIILDKIKNRFKKAQLLKTGGVS